MIGMEASRTKFPCFMHASKVLLHAAPTFWKLDLLSIKTTFSIIKDRHYLGRTALSHLVFAL
jgi:hypothetical protein